MLVDHRRSIAMKTEWAIICLTFFLLMPRSEAQNNCNNVQIGDRDRGGQRDKGLTDPTDITVIVTDTTSSVSHQVDCCGVVTQWLINVCKDHATNPIALQVWRPETSPSFMLVGEQLFNPTGEGPVAVPVTVGNKIYTQPGDKLGFTGNSLRWRSKTGGDNNLQETVYAATGLSPSVGSSYDLPTEHPLADQPNERLGFAIEMYVGPRDDPTCNIRLALASFAEDSPVGTTIGTVTTTEVDVEIPGYTYTLTTTPTLLPVTIDSTTGEITTTGNLTATNPSTSYTIQARTTEQICAKFGSCTKDVVVDFKNHVIEISSLPTTGTLIESTEAVTQVHLIETYDMNRNAFVDLNPNCSVANMNPAGAPFSVTTTGSTTKFSLNYDASSALNAAVTSTYLINVQCDDQFGGTTTETFTLTITDNAAPTVNNAVDGSGRICATVPAKDTTLNTVVLPLSVTDTEGDTVISFNFVSTLHPDSPFAWDSTNHRLYATKDLIDMEIDLHEFTVDVYDKWNNPVTHKLCIILTGLNSRPVFSNCPAGKEVEVLESYTAGTLLFKADGTDANKAADNQVFEFGYTVMPASFTTYFTMNTLSGEIQLATPIDYETTVTALTATAGCINVKITLSDGVHFATTNCDVCLKVTGVNEPPVLDQTSFTVAWDEQAATVAITEIDLSFSDPETTDTHTYTKLVAGDPNGYFSVDSTTGVVSQVKDIDYDSMRDHSFTFVVKVTDSSGLEDEALITINSMDVNDNDPTFADSTTTTIDVDDTTPTYTYLLNATVTDADSGLNAELSCGVLGTMGFGGKYFVFDNFGNLMLKKAIGYSADTQFLITIYCDDKGTPSRQGCKQVLVRYQQKISKTEADVRQQPCFLCTPGGVCIFTLLMGIAAVACLAGLYGLWGLALKNICNRIFARILNPRKPHHPIKRRLPYPRRMPEPKPRIREPEISKKKFEPPEVSQSTRFDFWKTTDSEVNAVDPKPSVTALPF